MAEEKQEEKILKVIEKRLKYRVTAKKMNKHEEWIDISDTSLSLEMAKIICQKWSEFAIDIKLEIVEIIKAENFKEPFIRIIFFGRINDLGQTAVSNLEAELERVDKIIQEESSKNKTVGDSLIEQIRELKNKLSLLQTELYLKEEKYRNLSVDLDEKRGRIKQIIEEQKKKNHYFKNLGVPLE